LSLYNHRCIYCGKGIPSDIGLRCAKCDALQVAQKGHQYTRSGNAIKDYDREFSYDQDTIEPEVAKIMNQAEERNLSQSSQKAKEEFLRLYEQNVESRKQFRWANQEELQTKREGRILHMNEFMRLLQSALPSGSRAWYTDKGGMANTLGLYVNHPGFFPACTHERGTPHYVGFVQVPLMQEFEELHFDRYNVPLGSKRRGWRTVLLKLIESGILTESAAHSAFGAPEPNAFSRRYNEYLKFIRTRPTEVEQVETKNTTPQLTGKGK